MITLVEGFKAFDGEGGDFALRAVCRISNVDKHLELVPVAPSGIMNYLSCYTIEDAPGPFNFLGGLASLKDGIMLCRLGLNGTITPNSPDAQIGVAGRIILGRVSIYEGQPLLPFLSGLVDRVRDAYNQIVHHLHDTGRI